MATKAMAAAQGQADIANKAGPKFGGNHMRPNHHQEQSSAHDQHAVRFAPTVEEISLEGFEDGRPPTVTKPPMQSPNQSPASSPVPSPRLSPASGLSSSRRLSHFHFEPVSLPPSRTTSIEGSIGKRDSPTHMSSLAYQAMQSPPLTPSGTGGATEVADKPSQHSTYTTDVPTLREPHMITPQHSSSVDDASEPHARTVTLRPKHNDRHHHRSASGGLAGAKASAHRRGAFSLGAEPPSSAPASREASPSRASELYSRPATPVTDVDGPYAANKRRPQRPAAPKRSVSPRFRFDTRSSTPTPATEPKRPLLHPRWKSGEVPTLTDTARSSSSKTSSFATLKRFFKRAVTGDGKGDVLPAGKRKEKSSTKTLSPSSSGEVNPPFADDHTLEARYGKIDRVLGSGAGGSVMLMKRDDGRVYAVKEFRQRQPRESRKRYTKKITAEFCVASALHHSNIIETMDIVEVKDRWFQVMEYAPYDLFSIVMSGKMSREEVTCCWLQLLSGVTYLHSCGVAHRDLKLDNVVVTKEGIMKIIDFGSAHVFQYPHESTIQYAEGVVGSDPYMAPEVYDPNTKAYDPRASDIWSMAIIFCCMTLKRFPWRLPAAAQDKSYRLFTSPPSPGHDPRRLLLQSKSSLELKQPEPQPSQPEATRGRTLADSPHQRSHSQGATQEKKEVIAGPWRILRQLPRESRHIIWRMLEIEPKRRAKMEEIIRDPWVADTVICRELENGQVVHAPGHKHTLIEQVPTPDTNGKKSP